MYFDAKIVIAVMLICEFGAYKISNLCVPVCYCISCNNISFILKAEMEKNLFVTLI